MHSANRLLLLCLALTGWVAADVPQKPPLNKYTNLWTNSPFTSKPPPAGPAQIANPMDDYTLSGVSPITGGYRVTLLNKKNPEERIITETNKPSGGFVIQSVTRVAGDPLATVVRMANGSQSGTIAFDSKLLALAAPKAPAPPNNPQAQPNIPGVPPQPNGQVPPRQPRPRVIPPPAPGVNPQPPQPPAQNQPQIQGGPRPDRRGTR
ncbi:MAG: hypothetical protein H8M99_09090 [Gloeobacteraceae cyanobacterium ES-bin-144]|nr:hypothetical protein [Verrucomicrobiales bacterium]